VTDDERQQWVECLQSALERRFGVTAQVPDDLGTDDLRRLSSIAMRRSHRSWSDRPVGDDLIRLLVLTALSAPSKSDLQQADIIHVRDGELRAAVAGLVPSMSWVATAPAFLMICGNNRRIRQVGDARCHPFANDHLDAFFNASVDGGIHMAYLLMAAEMIGLGGCPVSVIRNRAVEASALLGLPEHVFPVAGLALGWPDRENCIVPRLSPSITFHTDRFEDAGIAEIEAYDRRRRAVLPYGSQRRTDLFGSSEDYGWMEEKARHYSLPERQDFGAFVRGKGFRLD